MVDLNEKLAEQIRGHKKASASSKPSKSKKSVFDVCPQRTIAFIIDILTLVALGRVISVIAGKWLLGFGENGWWIGLIISALYFAIFDSSVGGGKTLGKRLTGIKVKGVSGKEISFLDALLRFVPFGLIFAIEFSTRFTDPTSGIIHGLQMFEIFIIVAIATFAIFHPQHRALQDLLLDSVVVREQGKFKLPEVSVRKPVFALCLAYLLFGGLYVIETSNELLSREGKLTANMWRIINARKNSNKPYVFIGESSSPYGFNQKTAFVYTSLNDNDTANSSIRSASSASIIKSELVQKNTLPANLSRMEIFIRKGYDIGIWRDYNYDNFSFSTTPLLNKYHKSAPTIYRRVTKGQSQMNRQTIK